MWTAEAHGLPFPHIESLSVSRSCVSGGNQTTSTEVSHLDFIGSNKQAIVETVKQISSAGIIIFPLAVKFEVTFHKKDEQTKQIHSALRQWFLARWSISWR